MSALINVFDTETDGMPDWKQPSEAGHQPHIVEIASLLCDAAGNVIDSYKAIVRPDGWEIPAEMTAIHGISHEFAMDVGIPEKEALDGFLALHARAGIRVAHNATFDDRIIRIAMSRYHSKALADSFKESTEKFCTCRSFGDWPYAYLCRDCFAYVGLHPGTDLPLGTLADKPMREARKTCKAPFELIWRDHMTRKQAYAWLAQQLGITAEQCHFGLFDIDRCHQARKVCEQYLVAHSCEVRS